MRDPMHENTRWLKALVFIAVVSLLAQLGQTVSSTTRQSRIELDVASIKLSMDLVRRAKIGQDTFNEITIKEMADIEARLKVLETKNAHR